MSTEDLRTRLKNVHAFAVTPFDKNDLSQLDLIGLEGNLAFLIEKGVKVITLGGGTGEVNALTVDELVSLARTGLEVAGDCSLVLPTLPGNLKVALDLAPRYEKMGARIVLAMAPFVRDQVPEDLDGVFNYYRILSKASGLAIMPYNTQAWPPDFFVRLSEIDLIVGIKDPCHVPHNLFRAIQLLGERFVWIGNKRHNPGVLHFRYQAGIEGFTAGIINFAPELLLALHQAGIQKDWPRMIEIQAQLAPLDSLRNVYGEAMLKIGLDLIGLTGGPVRPPRTEVPAEGCKKIQSEIRKLNLEIIK